MKKITLLSAVVSLLLGTTIHAQVSTVGNKSPIFPPNPFLGWGGAGPGGPKTLEIRNNYNLPIEFYTNSTQRMHINPDFSPTNQGFIGMGNSFSAPQSRLHINEMDPVPPVNGGTACYAQWTNTATGNATANDGLRIGLTGAGIAEIRQQENLPLLVYTNNTEQLVITEIGNVIIHNLACDNCMVMADKTGQLYTHQLDIDELLAKIALLEKKLTDLETLLAENE